MLEKEYM